MKNLSIKSLKNRLKKLEKYFERKGLSFSTEPIIPKKEGGENKFIIKYPNKIIIGRSNNKNQKEAEKEALADALQKVPKKYFQDNKKKIKNGLREVKKETEKIKMKSFRNLQGIKIGNLMREARFP